MRAVAARTGQRLRLPTEAEWEWACRAGTTTPFVVGQTLSTDLANYNGSYGYGGGGKGLFRQQTTPAGSFPPNAWGLYDLHGNVWEWCEAWDGGPREPDARGPAGGHPSTGIGVRGGAWGCGPRACRSACREGAEPAAVEGGAEAADYAAGNASWALGEHAASLATVDHASPEFAAGGAIERAAQAALLRCVFGLLSFCPASVEPTWRTLAGIALANSLYDERRFEGMPILGDALEESGCDNEDILSHCRGQARAQCSLLRCLFSNPFQPLPTLLPSLLTWHGGLVAHLAQAAYEERSLPQGTLAPAAVAVLADALEERDLAAETLLTHLRGNGPHVRGCHAVDALLGRG